MDPDWSTVVSVIAAIASALAAIASVVVASLGVMVNAFAAGAACWSMIVVALTAVFVVRQVSEMRRSTDATAHKAVTDLLSNERLLRSRRIVFTELDGVDYQAWTQAQRDAADDTCRNFDAAGQMVGYRFVQESYVADHWAQPLENAWRILKPYVESLRRERNAYEIWDNFEDLAQKAKHYRKTTPSLRYADEHRAA